jgi:hypothetical protein
MRADPESDEDSIFFDAQGTPTETYAYRVNIESFMHFLFHIRIIVVMLDHRRKVQ